MARQPFNKLRQIISTKKTRQTKPKITSTRHVKLPASGLVPLRSTCYLCKDNNNIHYRICRPSRPCREGADRVAVGGGKITCYGQTISRVHKERMLTRTPDYIVGENGCPQLYHHSSKWPGKRPPKMAKFYCANRQSGTRLLPLRETLTDAAQRKQQKNQRNEAIQTLSSNQRVLDSRGKLSKCGGAPRKFTATALAAEVYDDYDDF